MCIHFHSNSSSSSGRTNNAIHCQHSKNSSSLQFTVIPFIYYLFLCCLFASTSLFKSWLINWKQKWCYSFPNVFYYFCFSLSVNCQTFILTTLLLYRIIHQHIDALDHLITRKKTMKQRSYGVNEKKKKKKTIKH